MDAAKFNLLIGCKIKYEGKSGIVLEVLKEKGDCSRIYAVDCDSRKIFWAKLVECQISELDMNLIVAFNKDYTTRKKILEQKINRFELLDFGEDDG